MTQDEFIEVRNVAFGLWNRSVFGDDADNVTKAWGMAIAAYPAKIVVAALRKLASDTRRMRHDGTSPFPTVPELVSAIRSTLPQSAPGTPRLPDLSTADAERTMREADDFEREGKRHTAEWLRREAQKSLDEIASRRSGGRPRPVPVDVGGLLLAVSKDQSRTRKREHEETT